MTSTPVLSAAPWDRSDRRRWTLGARPTSGTTGYAGAADGAPDGARTRSSQLVKDSGLRGRGGAGFPTGMKWGFIPQGDGKPHYLVVNADECEPGTCKDIPLMMADPHALVEGVIIASYAIRARTRSSTSAARSCTSCAGCRRRCAEAYAAGLLGKNILGSGYDLEIIVHAGAGAYICGEETALLDSLEGRRGQPRLRPPFPAVAGLYASPDGHQQRRVDRQRAVRSSRTAPTGSRRMGTEKSPGFKLFSLSGHVARPGQYEAPLGMTLRELLDLAGGVREGHELKFWTPGGSSTPILTAEHLDMPLDFEGVGGAGSMLGTTALQVFDETTCVVRGGPALDRVLRARVVRQVHARAARARSGWCRSCTGSSTARAREEDLDQLLDLCDNILGRSFCALGDGATSPITSSIQYFRDEYVEHLGTAAARSTRPRRRCSAAGCRSVSRDDRHDTTTAGAAVAPRDDLVDLTIDGFEVRRAQGHAGDPGRRADRHPDPAVLRPPAARPGRRLPPVPGRGRDGTAAQCPSRRPPAPSRSPTAWWSRPSSRRRSPTRRSRASWSSCSSTTRWTARSATRAASARCRTRR